MATPAISLVVPAYNEAARISATLSAVESYFQRRYADYEIIVVADGDDGSSEIAGRRAARNPRLRVVGSPQRRGKGRAVRDGVAQARGAVIGFMDADGKIPIEELGRLLPWLDRGYDLVIGSRRVPGARVEVPQPRYRRVGGRLFGLVVHLILGLRDIRDTQCGFKFFRHAAAKDLFMLQRIDGYMFDVEVLGLAQRRGYRIREVGIRWRDDADSRLAPVAGNWRNFLDILRIRLRPPGTSRSHAEAVVRARAAATTRSVTLSDPARLPAPGVPSVPAGDPTDDRTEAG